VKWMKNGTTPIGLTIASSATSGLNRSMAADSASPTGLHEQGRRPRRTATKPVKTRNQGGKRQIET
ncbi:MAG: hypothetical protein AB9M60_09990, partial [Leptothrix sp. (in: b-proteobacteria)]